MNRSTSATSTDAGFSLVELAVYILVLGIISSIIAAVMVSLFRSEQTVSGVTNASNDSQVISTVLGNDIRNARAIKINPDGFTASVAGSDPTAPEWMCVRWTVAVGTPPNESTLTRQSVADTGTVPTNWGAGAVFATGVTRIGTTPYFSGIDTVTQTPTRLGSVTYSLAVPTTSDAALHVTGQLTNRVSSPGSDCW